MSKIIEKRRATIINVFYFALLLALFYCVFKWLMPLVMPFIFAFITASLFNKPISAITKKTPLKRSYVSVAAVILLLIAVSAVFFLIGIELFEKLSGFYNYLISQLQNTTALINGIKLWIIDFTAFLPESIRNILHENITVFFDNIINNGFGNLNIDTSGIDWAAVLTMGGEVITGTVGKIPSFLIAFIVFIISTVFISSDYDRIKAFIVNQFSEKNAAKISSAWHLGTSSLKKMLKAYGMIILITTFELTVGLYVFKFIGLFNSPYIIFIAFGIAIIDIIPVLGTGTVLLPWAVISFLTGKIGMGIALLILYIIILVIRQIIEPKLVAGQVGLPPIATIVAMYVGSKTLGILGFFILPFIVILLKVFNDEGIISIFKTGKKEDEDEPVVPDEEADVKNSI